MTEFNTDEDYKGIEGKLYQTSHTQTVSNLTYTKPFASECETGE